uniref:CUE domain-containing protein n=1 Tax=Hyaloperonospora arabidopsidis (strain Emoy2) TaxID=559515 RepID=M4B6C7_HYAAE
MDDEQTALKIMYKGKLHRLRVELTLFSLELCGAVHGRGARLLERNVAGQLRGGVSRAVASCGRRHVDEQTNETLKTVIQDAREALQATRMSIQELSFDQIIKKTTEGLKCAAEGIGEFAKEVVVKIKNIWHWSRRKWRLFQRVHGSRRPLWLSRRRLKLQWRLKATAPVVVEPVVDGPVVVAALAVVEPVFAASSEDEIKWSEELFMVRNNFPGVETSEVVNRLEQCNGNMLVVVDDVMYEM